MWSPPLATPYSVAVRIQWIRISRRLACQCHFNCMVLYGMLLNGIAWYCTVLHGMVWPWQLGKVGMNGIAVRRMWFAWYLWLRWTPYPSHFLSHIFTNLTAEVFENTQWRKPKSNAISVELHSLGQTIRRHTFWLISLATVNTMPPYYFLRICSISDIHMLKANLIEWWVGLKIFWPFFKYKGDRW